MNNDKDYASESDLSDEDFCPEENAGEQSSDDEGGPDDDFEDDEENVEANDETKSSNSKGKRSIKRKAGTSPQNNVDTKRSTRHSRRTDKTATGSCQEKDKIESDDEDKARADALWADFLGDVKQPSSDDVKSAAAAAAAVSTKKPTTNGVVAPTTDSKREPNNLMETPQKVTITEVLDFAGEEVRIEKTVNVDNERKDSNKSATLKSSVVETVRGRSLGNPLKRIAAPSSSGGGGGVVGGGSGSGLNSLLSQINKKKKISVLEKTKMDWNNFKKDEGIEEQLQTFNKGKDGFLERQDFLERTDLRQFEIERNLRQSRRNH